MGTIANLLVKIGADPSKLKTGLAAAASSVSSFAGAAKKAAGVATVGLAAGVAAVGTASVAAAAGVWKLAGAASDLEEAQNVVTATFSTSGAEINKWAATVSTAYGIGRTDATKMVGTLGAMIKTMTGNEAAAEDMSKQVVALAGDFASFYNMDSQAAFEKIRAGLMGETEPLKQIGYNLSVATLEAYAMQKGMKASFDSLSEGDKVQLRFQYLMEASADAQGDFQRTSGGLANSQRIMRLNFQNIAASLGQAFIPMVTKGTQEVSKMAERLAGLFEDGFQESDIVAAGEEISGLLLKGLENITKMLPQITKVASNTLSSLISMIVRYMPKFLPELVDGALNLFQALLDAIAENKQPILETITTVVRRMADFLVDNIAFIASAAVEIIIALATGLIAAIPRLIARIPEICKSIYDSLVGYDWASAGAEIMAGVESGAAAFSEFDWGKKVAAPVTAQIKNGIIETSATAAAGIDTSKFAVPEGFGSAAQILARPAQEIERAYTSYEQYAKAMTKASDAQKRVFNPAGVQKSTGKSAASTALDALKQSVKGLVDEMRSKTSAFASFVGLFDTFERKTISGERLLNRLKAQIKAMSEWRGALATLEQRGVSQAFLQDLRAMGPAAVDSIAALSRMTDTQLQEYNRLYNEKYKMAGSEAQTATAGQTRIDTNIENQINLSVTGSKGDATTIANEIVRQLRAAGYHV